MSQITVSIEQYKFMEARIDYLGKVNRWILDSLDMVSSLGDLQRGSFYGKGIQDILEVVKPQIQQLANFRAIGFMLVNEKDSDFSLASCEPGTDTSELEREAQLQIQEGNFAWALQQNRSVIVPACSLGKTVLLHVMASRSSVMGMFVGVIAEEEEHISEASKSLLSVILLNTAIALECSALYAKISEHNQDLEQIIQKRTNQLEDALRMAEAANAAKSEFL
ncbi:MAG: hypothetical protein U0V70_19525, partial [Terriglobia bacterium]